MSGEYRKVLWGWKKSGACGTSWCIIRTTNDRYEVKTLGFQRGTYTCGKQKGEWKKWRRMVIRSTKKVERTGVKNRSGREH